MRLKKHPLTSVPWGRWARVLSVAVVSALVLAPSAMVGAAGNNPGTPVPPATALGVTTAAVPSDVRIALFFDPAYVDTASDGSGEAYNVQQTLISQGFSVTTFTGTSTAAWTAALADADVVVIPELEVEEDLGIDLEPGALAALQAFLNSGGRVAMFVDSAFAFMEIVLGLPTFSIGSDENCPCTKTAAAAGTAWASGPDTLPSNNATYTLTLSSVPSGTQAIYADDDEDGEAGLAFIPYGSGGIVYFAWDWFFDDEETDQFANWFEVLRLTMLAAARTTEPAPTPPPVVLTPNFTG